MVSRTRRPPSDPLGAVTCCAYRREFVLALPGIPSSLAAAILAAARRLRLTAPGLGSRRLDAIRLAAGWLPGIGWFLRGILLSAAVFLFAFAFLPRTRHDSQRDDQRVEKI